ncbi:MAG: type II toxin-antitoxin system YafQ family toxin [Tannerella sp.]|jgi:mRNA interferase YafQ|nr:type II toxin-antitoxin system YafQ family toxin [Tannerella sp.]
MFKISYTKQYLKDLELMKKRGLPKSELDEVVKLLSEGKPLAAHHKDHPLKGKLNKYRECHIRPNWLLIYKIDNQIITLILTRTGTHSDLFGKNRKI